MSIGRDRSRALISRLCALSMIAGLAVARASIALADPPVDGAPTDDPKARASALNKEGNDLAADGQYPEALDKFRAAYAIFPSPKLLLNIGTTLRNMGRNAEAAESYEAYLSAPDRDAGRVDEVTRILREIDAVVGHITVHATVAGSTVTIDGKELGAAPLDRTLRVEPGTHKVVAEKAGMQAFVGTLTLKGGETQVANADPLPPGVVLKTNTVTVETGRGQRIAAVIVGSTGIAAGIVGGVFGGLALQTNNDAAAHCSKADPTVCDTTGVAIGADATQKATISTVLISAGGAALLGGVILWFTAPSKSAAPPKTALDGTMRVGVAGRVGGGEARFAISW